MCRKKPDHSYPGREAHSRASFLSIHDTNKLLMVRVERSLYGHGAIGALSAKIRAVIRVPSLPRPEQVKIPRLARSR